jgi:hypothetical protein
MIGLCLLVEDFKLQVPLPATRSQIAAGARKTIATDGKVLEQYPKNYMPKGLIGNLRFALRYEPIALDKIRFTALLLPPPLQRNSAPRTIQPRHLNRPNSVQTIMD